LTLREAHYSTPKHSKHRPAGTIRRASSTGKPARRQYSGLASCAT